MIFMRTREIVCKYYYILLYFLLFLMHVVIVITIRINIYNEKIKKNYFAAIILNRNKQILGYQSAKI